MPFHPQGCKTLFRRSWTRHVKSVRKGKYKMTLEELLKAQGLSDEQIRFILPVRRNWISDTEN